jgi:hypothetical protein
VKARYYDNQRKSRYKERYTSGCVRKVIEKNGNPPREGAATLLNTQVPRLLRYSHDTP